MSGFQVRHKEFGIYQGSFIGLGFWYPTSEMPEQGFCKFPTYKDAQQYIDFLCSQDCADPLNKNDLFIEDFDHERSEKLKLAGLASLSLGIVKE